MSVNAPEEKKLKLNGSQEGYDKEHATIVNFWSVFHDLSDADKKKFLKFLTGTDRVPILGLKSLNIIIQKANDDNFLPVAHTWSVSNVRHLKRCHTIFNIYNLVLPCNIFMPQRWL
jgi:hypothetical protein